MIKAAMMKIPGSSFLQEVKVNDHGDVFLYGKAAVTDRRPLECPIIGTVYGTLLNFSGELEALGESIYKAPYEQPPKAPVLYIKPANTLTGNLCPVPIPEGERELQTGGALGIVIGRTASRVNEEEALEYVKGYTVVNDLTIPHSSVHRPAIVQKCRDSFCPAGPWIIMRQEVPDPGALSIQVYVNEELKQETAMSGLIRPVQSLIAEVTEFMTLLEGDVLLAGVPGNPPRVKEGDVVKISITGVGTLENRFIKEGEL
ncbi:fumarylacetoacetate hydrolase family protein [Metabacillus sp. 84]|uniref:fumarylacetoacetate hydrolase family protein n=1 Tax=Metabacillus sp. 84 TaxID=3404705 RepID=UPI003CEDB48F